VGRQATTYFLQCIEFLNLEYLKKTDYRLGFYSTFFVVFRGSMPSLIGPISSVQSRLVYYNCGENVKQPGKSVNFKVAIYIRIYLAIVLKLLRVTLPARSTPYFNSARFNRLG